MRSSVPRYIGICFSGRSPFDSAAVLWLANPQNPIPDTSGVLMIDSDGILKFVYGGEQPIAVSSNQAMKPPYSNFSATLLDSGNLVVRGVDSNGIPGPILWQSFDYPTDTLLPEMKLGFNRKTGHEWYLSSWISDQVPSPGAFKLGLDPDGSNQLIVWRRGEVYWRSGVWNNGSFPAAPELTEGLPEDEFRFVNNENESYFTYSCRGRSTQLIWELDDWGAVSSYIFDLDGSTAYEFNDSRPCNTDEKNRTAVCLNEKPSNCRNGSEFFMSRKGYIDKNGFQYEDYNTSLASSDCHAICWKDCSCMAYKSTFENGTGCTIWTRGSKFIADERYDQLYVLFSILNGDLPAGESTKKNRSRSIKNSWWVWVTVAVALVLTILLSAILCHIKRRNRKLLQQTGESEKVQGKSLLALRSKITPSYILYDSNNLKNGKNKGQELLLLSFHQITTATNNFSSSSKLGEGGFGPVYKGMLPDGQQIAVKRLSRSSGQGLGEFKNEITLIAELQHMNLVKLLGCCIEEEENILIYEYMPNRSLDSFLFDPAKRRQLDWKIRFNIVEGVSQGLLYLHKYSRLRVIHRDLKASNILLDDQMNPKISDFGLARIFGQNEFEANTNRVVGTYGYMSPEYAMNGIFSVKSDVYSFGVLLLEIISGLRNTQLTHTSGPLSLIEHAWNLWSRGASLELVDKSLDSSCPEHRLVRCVHVGLLCVQECALDRPTISDVTIMLTNETMSLPFPKQPGFYFGRYRNGASLLNIKSNHCSVYNLSITEMEAR